MTCGRACVVEHMSESDILTDAEQCLIRRLGESRDDILYQRLIGRQKLGRARERERRVSEVGETQEDEEDDRIVKECVRVMEPLSVGEVNDARAERVQRVEGFVSDNYHFEYKVRFLCGERQTAGMKQAEALVEREAKERCESDEGAAASAGGNGEEPAAAVADLASTVAKKRIANAASAGPSKLREIARDAGYESSNFVAKTAEISEKIAAKLRPLVKTIVEAGRERAKIHFDADELRAKVNAQTPGTKAFKDLYKQLMRVDDQLRDASTKFDDALRATLRAADDDGWAADEAWAWGRQVMMEVLQQELDKMKKVLQQQLDEMESEDSSDEDSSDEDS